MKPDSTTPTARPTLTELCHQAQAETAPVVARILPGEDTGRVSVTAFQSSI